MNPVLDKRGDGFDFEKFLSENYHNNPVIKEYVDVRWKVWEIGNAFYTKLSPEEYYQDSEARRAYVAQVDAALVPLTETVDQYVRALPPIQKPPELKRLRVEQEEQVGPPAVPHFQLVTEAVDQHLKKLPPIEKQPKLKKIRVEKEVRAMGDTSQKVSNAQQILTDTKGVFHCYGRIILPKTLSNFEKVRVAVDFEGNIYAFSLSKKKLKAQLQILGWSHLKVDTHPRQ